MRPLKARKNEYTFCDLESNVPKNAGLLMTGSHENAPVLFQSGLQNTASANQTSSAYILRDPSHICSRMIFPMPVKNLPDEATALLIFW